jgi:hypothetical protein
LNFWFENNPSGNPASSSLLKHPFKLLHFGEGLNLFFLVVVVVGGVGMFQLSIPLNENFSQKF